MLRFRVIIDLHLEFHKKISWILKIFENDNNTNIDYLVLAGDICTLDHMYKLRELYDDVNNKYKKFFMFLEITNFIKLT
jgi:predicted phosphodiesterase